MFRSSLYYIRLLASERESTYFYRISKAVLSIRLVTGFQLNSIYAVSCWLISAVIFISFLFPFGRKGKSIP